MTDLSPEQRRAEVARLHAEGRTQREIARELGVDHATVHRDLLRLQAQRVNGEHQGVEGEPVADEAVLVGATAEQPAAETLVEAGGGAAPDAPDQGWPWEYRPFDPAQEREQDVARLLAKIAEGGVGRSNLRAAVG